MKSDKPIRLLFFVGGLYDGLLGAAFLFMGGAVFKQFGVTPPNHSGYVQFPAALLLVFGIMFFAIALNPLKNRNLIPYGILLKVAYCGVIGFHWFTDSIPYMWKPFFVCDLVFLALFVWAMRALNGQASQPA